MATVTGMTVARIMELLGPTVVGAEVDPVTGMLTLQTQDGQSLVIGTTHPAITGRLLNTLYYTATGVFNKANYPDLEYVKVKVQGGGGGGGGCGFSNSAGSGGSAGGYAERVIAKADLPGGDIAVTVGGGGGPGYGGSNGGAGYGGGASSFGALASATGGGAGLMVASTGNASTGPQGPGTGTAPGGLAIAGGSGGPGYAMSNYGGFSGKGGDSMLGRGGNGQVLMYVGNLIGYGGSGYGSGGGGACAVNGNQDYGGNGAAGIVIVEVFG